MLRIKEICKEKGITMQELAKRLGITYQSLYDCLNTNGNPTLSRLQQIADALGVEIVELFTSSNTLHMHCPHCKKGITITIE